MLGPFDKIRYLSQPDSLDRVLWHFVPLDAIRDKTPEHPEK